MSELYLRENQLTHLPTDIAQLKNLKKVDLRANKINSLPPTVSQLPNLQSFDLRANPLPIPPEILGKWENPTAIIHYRSFGGNSPVIVVGNQADQKSLDIDRRGLQSKYPNIVEFVETCCSDPGHGGIGQLKQLIQQQIRHLPHVFDALPESWFAVKAKLETLDADYIEYHQYKEMCAGERVDDDQSQKTLVGFLHDLGIALNFSEDPRLQQDSVLNPEWVTTGVYSILNDNALITEHKGILDRAMLHEILDSRRYPPKKHLFILDIMRKFELCFPLEGFEDTRYLLPDLLSKEEPDTGDWDDALPFQYHYNVLPGSIMSRFIVRMNQLISKRTYWRSGAVLLKRGNKALVKADQEDRKIFVWVGGNRNTRRMLLESIRDQFDYLHSSIPGLEVDEKVPLPSHPHILVDYTHLLDLEAMGETEFVPSGLKMKVKVKDLLSGIETIKGRQERQAQREEWDTRFRTAFTPLATDPKRRMHLFNTLSTLPIPQFEALAFGLRVPRENLGHDSAPQGVRVSKLLEWAESPIGCGLDLIEAALGELTRP